MSPRRTTFRELAVGDMVTGISGKPMNVYYIAGFYPEVERVDLRDRDYGNSKTRSIDDACFYLPDMNDNSDNNVHKHIHEEKPKMEKRPKMNKFDTDEIKDNVMSSAINMKNSLVQMKTGQAVIASIRASLKASPGVTPEMGILLDSKYADIAIGVVLSIAAPMVSKSTTIIKASQAAGFAGTMAAADKLSFIEEFIEKAIGVIPQAIAKVEGIMGGEPVIEVDTSAKDIPKEV